MIDTTLTGTPSTKEKVRALRANYTREQMSDYKIAELVGVSRQRVHQILTGYSSPANKSKNYVRKDAAYYARIAEKYKHLNP